MILRASRLCSRCKALMERLPRQSTHKPCPPLLRRFSPQTVRLSTSAKLHTSLPKNYKPTPGPVLPERLLIYNAGLPKTYLVAIIKVTTVLLFGGTCIIQLPTAYAAESPPNWPKLALIFACGTLPLLSYAYLSGPFVNTIFLRLPQFARRSKDLCIRYSAHLPPDAPLEIVTIRLLPWAKTTGVRLSELRLKDKSKKPWWDLRLPNMYRVKPKGQGHDQAQHLGWMPKMFRNRQREFWYDESKEAGTESRVPGVWENVLQQIRRNSA